VIIETRDWRRFVSECHPDDLDTLHPDWRAFDWDAMLALPGWHMITDGQGSWCVLEPVNGSPHHFEGHLIIAANMRGKAGLSVAQTMLDWMTDNLPIATLYACAGSKKVALFLRWLGFDYLDGHTHFLKWSPEPTP
jgi:hypothetical protein